MIRIREPGQVCAFQLPMIPPMTFLIRAAGRLFRYCPAWCAGLCLCAQAWADLPLPFTADYVARYGGFRASAERALQYTGDGEAELTTSMALKLLGKTITGIDERSTLVVVDRETLLPRRYTFEQTGIGKRRREIRFDWESAHAAATVNDTAIDIPLTGRTLDNLSAYLEIGQRLREGQGDIMFPVIDKGELEPSRFRLLGEEILATGLGDIATLKLEKVRDSDSDRHTEIWLAPAWDYLLVKLVQEEPGSRTIRLDLKQAVVGDEPVRGSAGDNAAAAD